MPTKRKRVAVLTNQLLDWHTRKPAFGGGERYCLRIGELLRHDGFDVRFFQAGLEPFEGEYYGFPVEALKMGAYFSEFQHGVCDAFHEATSSFDHVIINVPAYASGRVREDALMVCHGIWFDHDRWPIPIRFRTAEWFAHLYRAFTQPAQVISVDTNSVNVIRALWPDVAGRMHFIPNWVDTALFHPAPRNGKRLTVLIPRRAEVNRGTRIIGDILREVPHDVDFLWVGGGDASEVELLQEVARRDRRLRIASATFEEMPAIYQGADICVIPTLACEGTSLSCLEALASGCAVVATTVGGLPDLIQHGENGLLAEPTAAALAESINRLISDAQLRKILQENGVRSAATFSIEQWERRWRGLLAGSWAAHPIRSRGASKRPPEPIQSNVALAPAIANTRESAARLAFVEGQLAEWNSVYDATAASLRFVSDELSHWRGVAEDRSTSLDKLNADIQRWKDSSDAQQASIDFLQKEIEVRESSATTALDGLRAGLATALSEEQNLKSELATARTEQQNLKSELSAARTELATAQTEQQNLRSELATAQTEQQNRRRTAEALQAEIEIRNAQLQKLEAHSAQQTEGIEWLRSEVAIREKKLQDIYRSQWWRVAGIYWRGHSVAARALKPFSLPWKRAALKAGRVVLPKSAKRFLKRYWDPNRSADPSQKITPQEAALLRTPAALTPSRPHSVTPRPATYDVICFSIIDWDFRWQRPQQVMARFAREGHRVFFFKTTEFLPAGSKRYSLRQLRENVWEVTLAAPRPIDVYAGDIPPDLVDAVIDDLRQLRAEFNISAAVSVVQVPTWAPAAYRARESFGWKVLYDCMDEWNTFPGMKEALIAQEERLVSEADVVTVSAQRLVEKWRQRKPDLLLVRNGADFEHYANVQPNELLAGVPHPIVGYFGAIADWFDLPLMLRLAKERPQYSFVLIGGIFNVPMEELQSLPNVRILGQKPYDLMPAYLWHFDACIIPFVVNAVTEATDPVKFYEYISMGKPVVAPRMPELFPYGEMLYIGEDHDDFIAKVDLAAAERDADLAGRRIALARENSWTARVDTMKKGIGAAHPRASIIIVSYFNLEYTKLCIESVFRNTLYPNYEIIVVDNASTDGTREYLTQLEREHDNVRIILNEHNLGFARANNQGLVIATGEYLILLNNDTVVPNGWLTRFVTHLDTQEIGLAVTVTNFSGNESKIEVWYKDLEEMEDFASEYTREHEGQLFDIRVAAMYCVGMRRAVFEQIGPLDEQFSVGMFEDDDYSHRMRLAGYRVVCVEGAFVHHFGQASFKKLSPSEYQAIWDRNQKLYEKKWGVQWVPHTARAGAV